MGYERETGLSMSPLARGDFCVHISPMTTLIETFPLAGRPTKLRLKCATCGRSQKADKGRIAHMDSCATKEQPAAQIVVEHDDTLLREFAANVRRTGLTGGHDDLVAECVRKGFLSESDAMNTDD